MKQRHNCFDLIRHFAALLVLYSHHFALSKLPEPTFPYWDTYGFLGVVMFFAISGYFMPTSFANSGNMIEFIAKRCKRIFPGLIVCSFLMIYVIGSIFGADKASSYLLWPSTFKSWLMMSTFVGRDIPGVFSSFIYPNAVNGSLWTLPVEFGCYLILGAALTFVNSYKTVLALFIICLVTTATLTHTKMDYAFYGVPMSYLAMFGIAFFGGSLLSMTRKSWELYRIHLVAISVVMLCIMQRRPEMQVIGTLSLTVLTIIIGTSFKDRLIDGKFDLSYGIYIYAFPIQQLTINLVTPNFWGSMAISAVLSIVAGYLSSRFVEKPFLKRKPMNIVYVLPEEVAA